MTGSIPASLGDLSNLTRLYLYGNELTGTIPTDLGDLTNLQQLSLSSNKLTGTIPTEVADLTNLQELYLNGNADLTGPLPLGLMNLNDLTTRVDPGHRPMCAGGCGVSGVGRGHRRLQGLRRPATTTASAAATTATAETGRAEKSAGGRVETGR